MASVQGPATASVASGTGSGCSAFGVRGCTLTVHLRTPNRDSGEGQPVKLGWASVGVAAGAVPTTVEVVAPATVVLVAPATVVVVGSGVVSTMNSLWVVDTQSVPDALSSSDGSVSSLPLSGSLMVVSTPAVVTRLIESLMESPNHRLPSGPTASPVGPPPAGDTSRSAVMVPSASMRPRCSVWAE
jgi:hypothetical protein